MTRPFDVENGLVTVTKAYDMGVIKGREYALEELQATLEANGPVNSLADNWEEMLHV